LNGAVNADRYGKRAGIPTLPAAAMIIAPKT
jgi:hypothetical protein